MALHSNPIRPYRLLPIALLLIALLLTSCGGEEAPFTLAPISEMPEYAQSASQTVLESYQFAIANPEMLTHQPCYCGCGSMVHTSNLSCFMSGVEEDGTIIFDSHAAGCGICIDIAQDVMRLTKEGKTQLEIRRYVDATYSPFGPSTDTPVPEA